MSNKYIRKDMTYSEIENLIFTNLNSICGFSLVKDPSGSFAFIKETGNSLIEIYATPNWLEDGILNITTYIDEEIYSQKELKFTRLNINKYRNHIESAINKTCLLV